MKSTKIKLLALILAVLNSCSDDKVIEKESGAYANGYFITNEGPFQNGSGSITFVGDDGIVSQNVYRTVNGEDLGNIVNSMYVIDKRGFIVVNNSSKVVVVDRETMEKIAVIQGNGIDNPRHFIVSRGSRRTTSCSGP